MSKPTIWLMPNRIEQDYMRTLNALGRQVGTALGNNPDPYSAIRRLRQISQHPPYREYCDAVALRMTTHMQTRVNGTWRTAAKQAGRGNEFYKAILEELQINGTYDAFLNMVYENAEWISHFRKIFHSNSPTIFKPKC